MIEHTFIGDRQHVAIPLALTICVIVAGLIFAFS
jgi:hypothetical protein